MTTLCSLAINSHGLITLLVVPKRAMPVILVADPSSQRAGTSDPGSWAPIQPGPLPLAPAEARGLVP